jgi:hypothetical protein
VPLAAVISADGKWPMFKSDPEILKVTGAPPVPQFARILVQIKFNFSTKLKVTEKRHFLVKK